MQLPFLGTKSGQITSSASLDARIREQDLKAHLPQNSVGYILNWFTSNIVYFRISRSRSSKFGDYRSPAGKYPARISVNRNMNRFDFLLTLVHEMAHHELLGKASSGGPGSGLFKRRIRHVPHGAEWKKQYSSLMKPLLDESVFPDDLLPLLIPYFETQNVSPRMNKRLVTALHAYDEPDGMVFIDSVPPDAVFSLPSGRSFRKGEKLRKRYRCRSLDNGKDYLFSPLARVIWVSS
jgi:SprT protein